MSDIPSFSLSGKVVIQFGGSGLLGRSLVEATAGCGATLVVASRDTSVLETHAGRLRKEGAKVHLETVDLLKESSIQDLVGRVISAHGSLDGMVYNAVSRPMQAYSDPLEKWEESMRLNATGFFAALRVCGEAMAKAGRGSIVNISSQMGMIGYNPFLYETMTKVTMPPDYFFHKGGMINLTRHVASHYGLRGVRVNVVSPGGIFNPDKPQTPDFLGRYAKMAMLGRMAEAKEIGGAVVFLLSDASSYVTAANLPVDGGYTAR